MIKVYKYKIKPNKEQKCSLNNFFGAARFVYNWGLEQRTKSYKENGTKMTYVLQASELTKLKNQEEFKWLKESPNVVLQQSLRNLDVAFTRFFRKKSNYPNFKSKRTSNGAVKFISSVYFDFEDWKVKLPKVGWVKLCQNRMFDQSVCKQGTCTVSKDKCGEYWCCINVDDGKPLPTRAKLNMDTAVGIDLGIKDFAILSDGTKYTNPKFLEKSEKRLKKCQKELSRKMKGSKNRDKARLRVARCHRKVKNQRNDFLQKLTTELVRKYNTICLENLNVKGMMNNHHLAKSIQSASWHEFVRQLEYKSEWYGKNVLFIGRFEPSSKMCHECGYINKELTLKDREWVCPKCGSVLDRDVNAARNIKSLAFDAQNLIGI